MSTVESCLAIDVARRLTSEDILERLTDLFIRRGVPDYIRSDNSAEFTAHAVRDWLARVGVRTLCIELGSFWKNGYIESFNGKLRDELLEREIFDTLLEAKVLIERWRGEYNTSRPHSSLGYRPPAPEAIDSAVVCSWSVAEAAHHGRVTETGNSNLNIGVVDGGKVTLDPANRPRIAASLTNEMSSITGYGRRTYENQEFCWLPSRAPQKPSHQLAARGGFGSK